MQPFVLISSTDVNIILYNIKLLSVRTGRKKTHTRKLQITVSDTYLDQSGDDFIFLVHYITLS